MNGIVLTKLDGTAKGGVAVAIAHDLKLPIRYVGVGEGIDDLVPFSTRRSTSTACSKRSGDTDRSADYMDARALSRGARPRTHEPESDGRRGRRDARWRRRRPGLSRAGRRAARRGARARRGGRARARRDALLHARAVLSQSDARVRASPGSSRRASRGSSPPWRIRIRSCAGAGSRSCASTASRSRSGWAHAPAVALNQPFFTLMRERRPFVMLKAATSLDGCIAAAPGRRTPLTSAPANRHAHRDARRSGRHRRRASGTILVDDPLLTARGVFRERPLTRVIFDRRLRTPPERARPLDTRRRPCHHRDDGRRRRTGRTCASRSRTRGAEIDRRATGPSRRRCDRLGGARRRIAAARRRRRAARGGLGRGRRRFRPAVRDAARAGLRRRAAAARAAASGPAELVERRVEPLGPDVLIEGYVHRPR